MDIQLPEQFQNKILRIFGEIAEKWIYDFPFILRKCIEKWELNNLEILNELSINLVCFADSEIFGKSVLKIGVPNPELNSEFTSLQIFRDKNICRLYDFDLKLGALLLERILPGTDITDISESINICKLIFDYI
jgi:streptomycin 6-kinase